MLDRRVGNQHGGGDRVHQQARIDELIWKQRAVGVRKFRLSFTVPVVVSIWLSTVTNVPVASFCLRSRDRKLRPSA